MRNLHLTSILVLMLCMIPAARAWVAHRDVGPSHHNLSTQNPKHHNTDRKRLMLKGYDPVSYFTSDKPSKGDPQLTAEHAGVIYRFSSKANQDAFLAEPTQYLPEYGGWCAKAIADKEFVDIDPLTYKITDGRLFLFYNGFFGNALDVWNKDEASLTQRADQNWRQILAE